MAAEVAGDGTEDVRERRSEAGSEWGEWSDDEGEGESTDSNDRDEIRAADSDAHDDDDDPRKDLEEETKKDEEEVNEAFPWGCEHYRRRCKIVSPCCGDVFWCRHCHNEEKVQNETDVEKMHEIDRFAIQHIICCKCGEKQPPAATCRKEGCGITFADYFCHICRFWDNNGAKKQTFHCAECGICRVGGRENFFHCKLCNACYTTSIKDSHKCIESAMKNACPICLDDMFTSTKQSHVLKCGHTIHMHCFRSLDMHGDFSILRCPTCSKTISHAPRLADEIDALIAQQEMPPEYRHDVTIFCNDCEERCKTPFHFVGLKCQKCGFYNTIQVDV